MRYPLDGVEAGTYKLTESRHDEAASSALVPKSFSRTRSALGSLDSCTAKCSVKGELSAAPGRATVRSAKGKRGSRKQRKPLQRFRLTAARRARARSRVKPQSVSHCLSIDAARELIIAADEAARIGLPLNHFLSVNWEKGGVIDDVRAIGDFWSRAKAWLVEHGAASAIIWVRETGRTNGRHAHLLLHVPAALRGRFVHRQAGWLAQCGLKRGKGNRNTQRLGKPSRRSASEIATAVTYATDLMHVVHYLTKEVEHAGRSALGISIEARGGVVIGKRSGTSQNIGRAARERQPEVRRATCVADLGGLSSSASHSRQV